MKKMGRRHRPFYRICATDARSPRDGRVLEELGTYDPSISDVDARVTLNGQRVDYWLSVGAQPSEKVGVLIKKYGTAGTRLQQNKAAREKLVMNRRPVEIKPPAEPAEKASSESAEVAAEPEAAAEPAEKASSESADVAAEPVVAEPEVAAAPDKAEPPGDAPEESEESTDK